MASALTITPPERYAALLSRAHDDPNVVAFWLGGSRGMGWATAHSDYDCAVVLADEAPADQRREIESLTGPGLDLMVMTQAEFERHAAWGSSEAWARYGYAHLTAIIDKTAGIQPLIDAKGRVPEGEVAGYIDASLDHLVNQLYRGLKCLRDGDPGASRLEAAEGVKPFLDAVFALHGGRLRPYYKYLAWELETHPLQGLPFDSTSLVARLSDVLEPDGALALQALLADTHAMFRDAGRARVFDGWGEAMDWMLVWRPGDGGH
jgi:hypothetical protein